MTALRKPETAEIEVDEEMEDTWLAEVAGMLRQLIAARMDVRQFLRDLASLGFDCQTAASQYATPDAPNLQLVPHAPHQT